MKALVYDLSIPKYLITRFIHRKKRTRIFPLFSCLGLKEIEEPTLPGNDWVKITTKYSGICGSDLGTILSKASFALEHYSSFPSVVGHENIGVVKEVGSSVKNIKKGDRVYVDPVLGCEAKGLDPCPACKDGRYSHCSRYHEESDTVGAGCITGFNSKVSGGWAECFLAHESQVMIIPDKVEDETAVLVDSLASAVQPVVTHFPDPEQTVLVYGCGIIGINTIGVLRELGFTGRIIAVYRYPYQGEIALKMGADDILNRNVIPSVADLTGAVVLKNSLGGPSVEGGVDLVFDTIGSAGVIDTSLRLVTSGGKVVVIGTASVLNEVDFTPVWFKEVTLVGTNMYSVCNWKGKKIRTYEMAMKLLEKDRFSKSGLVTHEFPLKDYKKALSVFLDKSYYKSMKVIFSPNK